MKSFLLLTFLVSLISVSCKKGTSQQDILNTDTLLYKDTLDYSATQSDSMDIGPVDTAAFRNDSIATSLNQ